MPVYTPKDHTPLLHAARPTSKGFRGQENDWKNKSGRISSLQDIFWPRFLPYPLHLWTTQAALQSSITEPWITLISAWFAHHTMTKFLMVRDEICLRFWQT